MFYDCEIVYFILVKLCGWLECWTKLLGLRIRKNKEYNNESVEIRLLVLLLCTHGIITPYYISGNPTYTTLYKDHAYTNHRFSCNIILIKYIYLL